MTNMKDGKSELRKQAEAKLAAMGEQVPELTENGSHVLIHELRTHQIELEMQNEALQAVELELTIARNKLTDLYDFSPVGYATIGEKAIIEQANLTFADLLGQDRSTLVDQPFTRFVVEDDQDIFYMHCKAATNSKQHQSIELRLKKVDGETFWALINTKLMPASDHKMLMAITDVSRRREAEDKFKDEVEEISRMNHLMIERELKLGGNRDEIHALKGENAQLRKNIAKDDE